MNDKRLAEALDVIVERVAAKTREVAELKRTANALAREAGGDAIYLDVVQNENSGNLGSIHPDQFYGKSPTVATKEYLELRRRAVPAEEIVQALEKGGFDFDRLKWNSSAKRVKNLSISLTKNSSTFHKLPNGTYGLVKFYPDIAEKKQRRAGSAEEESKDDATSRSSVENEIESSQTESP